MKGTRRDIIRWGLLGLGSLAVGCFEDTSSSILKGSNGEPLVKIKPPTELVDNPWTARVGQALLDNMSEKEKDNSFRALLDAAPTAGPAFAKFVRQRHRADLTAGRVQRVDGWLLSQTEAYFYAYVADSDPKAIDVPVPPPRKVSKPKRLPNKSGAKKTKGRREKKKSKKVRSIPRKKKTSGKTSNKERSGASPKTQP